MADSDRKSVPAEWANSADSADVVEPDSTKQASGWEAEKPPFENFNWFWQLVTNMLQNAEQYGIMQWSSSTTYPESGVSIGSDGTIYVSQTSGNVGNDPTTDDGTNWAKLIKDSFEYVELTDGTNALSQTADGTYTYSKSAFVGSGLDADEITDLYIRVRAGGDSFNSANVYYTFPGESTGRSIGGAYPSSDWNTAWAEGLSVVPVNSSQTDIVLTISSGRTRGII